MRAYWGYLALLVAAVLLGTAGLIVEAAAHPDGCHRWHSCPSDDGSYVCGDLGYCSECPDNQFCSMGRKRGAAPEATNTRRPTRTPDPTNTPRPTRTPEPVGTPRTARAAEGSGAARAGREGVEGPRSSGDAARPAALADAVAPADAALEDVRGSGAFGGTGAPLAAAPAPRPAPVERAPSGGSAAIAAEYAGIRVLGPLQWVTDREAPAIAGVVHHGGAETRTMVLTLFLLDARGERVGTVETVLWDLAPGESRSFVQLVPPLPAAPTDVSARIEPLAP